MKLPNRRWLELPSGFLWKSFNKSVYSHLETM